MDKIPNKNSNKISNKVSKIIVFDLDETLGYFVEFGIFWSAINEYLKYISSKTQLDQSYLNQLLDLYPEFLRPNIVTILKYLKTKKEENKCHQVMIYTNNQGPKIWANMIKNYFDNKINYPLFDKIIGAFKVNGNIIEVCRSSNYKTYKDFIQCTKIPQNTQLCFIDDIYYPEMVHDNVYYINIKAYTHSLAYNIMIKRFLDSEILKSAITNRAECQEYIQTFMGRVMYDHNFKSKQEFMIDKIISKKILEHLETFFQM